MKNSQQELPKKITDTELYIRVILAEVELGKEFIEKGSWHVDSCCCIHCQALYKWKYLSFWRKLKAKLNF